MVKASPTLGHYFECQNTLVTIKLISPPLFPLVAYFWRSETK